MATERAPASDSTLLVLCLHELTDHPSPTSPWTTGIADLENALSKLHVEGWKPVGVAELDRGHSHRVLLTFDDARKGAVEWLLARGHELGIEQAIVFVATCFQDVPHLVPPVERYSDFASWSDLRDVVAAGHTIGSHSHSHRDLTNLDAEEVHSDVERSCRRILEETGVESTVFAFPFGRHSPAAVELIRGMGFAWLMTTRAGLNDRTALAGGVVNRLCLRSDRGTVWEQVRRIL